MKKEQPDVAHELRDPIVPIVKGAVTDTRDTLPAGQTPTPPSPNAQQDFRTI